MTSYALNTGAINETPFPGAETGLSLIELLGTVEVTCQIPSFTVRLTGGASTRPSASGSASTTKRALLSATQGVSATCLSTALTKIGVAGQTASTATTSAGVGIALRESAETQAQAAYFTVNSYVSAKNSASVISVANSDVSGQTYVPRGATTTAAASCLSNSERKLAAYIEQRAQATAQAGIVMRNASGGITSGSVVATAASRISALRGASTLASASGEFSALIKLLRYPNVQPATAICNSIEANRGISFAASTTANSVANATIRLQIKVSAEAMGQAITSSAAADYGTAMPAPAERLMTVQGSGRSMEVTE
jgi:hypothetical protein